MKAIVVRESGIKQPLCVIVRNTVSDAERAELKVLEEDTGLIVTVTEVQAVGRAWSYVMDHIDGLVEDEEEEEETEEEPEAEATSE